MGRVKEESEFKSQLVTEICNISSSRSSFVDWYLLLRVEQNAGIDVIKKKYHKLALQLHPDKNKHPKAEIAFKLVSQAYVCLSDDTKRKAFDMERWNSCCNPRISSNSEELGVVFPKERLRSSKILQSLQEMRMRFKEEAEVIEKCLRTNKASSRKEYPVFNPSRKEYPVSNPSREEYPVFNPSRKESPIFSPSKHPFQGYPHHRRCTHKKPEQFWFSEMRNMLN